MTERIRVKASESGCWLVLRNGDPVAVYPPFMWAHAYAEAVREAVYQNLSIISVEITS